MINVEYNGNQNKDYRVYDTFLVSYSRYAEFKRLMSQKPFDEQSTVKASLAVADLDVYYADSFGNITKWKIENE